MQWSGQRRDAAVARANGMFYEDFVDTVSREKRVTATAIWQLEQMEAALQAFDREQEHKRQQRRQSRVQRRKNVRSR